MTKVSGGAAYLQLKPLKDNINQGGLQNLNNSLFRKNQLNAQIAAKKRAAKEKSISDWEKLHALNKKDFKASNTHFTNADEIITDLTFKLRDKYVEYYNLAKDSLREGNLAKQSEYEKAMMKIMGKVDEITSGEESYRGIFDTYLKMFQEGKISGVDNGDWEDKMQAFIKYNIVGKLDENDNIVYTGTTDKGETFEVRNIDLINRKFLPIEKQNIFGKDGLISNITNNLGENVSTELDGDYIRTVTGWNSEMENGALGQIDALVQDDRIMADLYYQLVDTNSKKRKDFTEDEKNKVKNAMLKFVKSSYDEKTNIKTNPAEIARKNRDAADKRQDKAINAADKRQDKDRADSYEKFKLLHGDKLDEQKLKGIFKNLTRWADGLAEEISKADQNDEAVNKVIQNYIIKTKKANTSIGDISNSTWFTWLGSENKIEINGTKVSQTDVNKIAKLITDYFGAYHDVVTSLEKDFGNNKIKIKNNNYHFK